MAATNQSSIESEHVRPVNEAVQEYRVIEDGALAYYLQEREIEHHYSSNVEQRRTVMGDIVTAKKLQDEEDTEARILTMDQQEEIKELDGRLAEVMQEELVHKHLMEEKKRKERERRDQETALMIRERDRRRDIRRNVEDHRLAKMLSKEEFEEENRMRKLSDEELAKRLQHEEKLRLKYKEEKRNNMKTVVEMQDEELARYIHERDMEEAEMMYQQEQRRKKGKKKTRMPPGDAPPGYYPDDLPVDHPRYRDHERPGPSSRNRPREETKNPRDRNYHSERSHRTQNNESLNQGPDSRSRDYHEGRTPEKQRSFDNRNLHKEEKKGSRGPQRPPPPKTNIEETVPKSIRERTSESPVFDRRRNTVRERQEPTSDHPPPRRTNSEQPRRPPPPQTQPEQLIDRMPAHFIEPLEGDDEQRSTRSSGPQRNGSRDNLQNDEDLEYGEGFSRLTEQESWYHERNQPPLQKKKSKGDCKQQ